MGRLRVRRAKLKQRVDQEVSRNEQKHEDAITLPADPNAAVESTNVKASRDEVTPRPE